MEAAVAVVSALLLLLSNSVQSTTDPSDVEALALLYSSLNNPPQLSGWKSIGGDPCEESWKGISCSGSAVTAVELAGLGLNGTLGYLLSNLMSLKTLDLADNNINEVIPYQLPPNLSYLNLASNNLIGNLPYSISSMVSLVYLNVSHNSLSLSIEDFFANLQNLSDLDLSFNNLSGDLPNSMGLLSNLSSLNIANNHFTGWIPQEFHSIPNLVIEGNSFVNGPAPSPPPFNPPPPHRSPNHHNHIEALENTPNGEDGQNSHTCSSTNKKSLTTGSIIGIVVGSAFFALCAILAALFCLYKLTKKLNKNQNKSRCHLGSPPVSTNKGIQPVHEFEGFIYLSPS